MGPAPMLPEDGSVRPSGGNPVLTLAAVCFGLFMVGLDATVVSIANPAIAADLGASFSQLQWVTNSYLLALAVLLVLGGKLGDRFGRKRLYLAGLVVFAVTSVGIGLIGTIGGVIALRAVQGVGAALLMPQTLALLRATWPREKFGMAVGIWGGISSVAIAAGPLIAGVLVEKVTWESVFYINAPIAVLGLIFGLIVLRESTAEGDSHIDLAGVLLLGAALFCVVFGVVQSASWGWGDLRTVGTIVLGLVVLALFVGVEARVRTPLLPPSLLASRGVSIGGLAFVANFFALLGITFLITLYLMNTRGSSTIEAGVQMLPLSAISIISAPMGAGLAARFGARRTVALGLLLMAVGLIGLVGNDADSSYWWLAIPFVLIAFGSGFAIPSGAEAIMGGAPVHLAGVAGGFQTTCIQLGGALGTAVLAAVVSGRVGAGGVSADLAEAVSQGIVPAELPAEVATQARDAFLTGLHAASIVAAVVAAVVAVLALTLLREREPESVEELAHQLTDGLVVD
ncbi:MFS transporter [Nocardioides sp.]|uniref:MFS transporter n=1 Tax=Nocardioides sp. TaxID=35761 RepID=UPI0026154EEB|nr:MFS transporter [Nocardioides sp.]